MKAQLTSAPQVGVRLHHARRMAGLTLKQLAHAAGCSESLLSKIEHDRTQPSLAMLGRIAHALGSSVSALTEHSGHAQSPVQRCGERSLRTLVQAHGVLEAERLTPADKGALLKGEILHLAPGASSAALSQIGHVLGYMLEGQLVLHIGEQSYDLHAGDSVGFAASTAHSLHNPTQQRAKILWVISPA